TDKSWLLSAFDQVDFYPVSEAEIDKFNEEICGGKRKPDIIESVFIHAKYLDWIQEHTNLTSL
ncbi:hypothetical protein CANTEDRAFT_118715, partial [Yamadazyma tenuis ATCC 10573]